MRERNKIFTLIGIFALLFFFGQLLFVPKTFVSSRLLSALQAPKVFFASLFNRATLLNQLRELSLENQSLRAQLVELKNQPERQTIEDKTFLVARVFSQYPFTSDAEILINAGAEAGLTEGLPVLTAPGIFLGTVKEVRKNTSVVETIFKPGAELPVKVGAQRIDALLVGAHEPRLTLISKSKAIAGGESVILASRELPFGLTLGTVKQVATSEEALFLEAGLEVPYQLKELQDVYIQLRP